MPSPKTDIDTVSVRLSQTDAEIEAAQRLRYQVFYEEHDAVPDDAMAREQRDMDEYDAFADHLVVVDRSNGTEKIVGTYRLLRQSEAERCGKFYTSSEFDIDPLLKLGVPLLELGRSCVLPEYRTRPVLQLLWQGIAGFVTEHDIALMFGCASFHNTDIAALSPALSYLYHNHLAPEDMRVRALADRFVAMDELAEDAINAREVFSALPPIIKGYLRLGAWIGDGAVIDEQFNTTDVCIIMPTNQVTQRYRKHYERKIQKAMPGQTTEDNAATGTE